jgi:hypothetical protein
MGRAQPGGQSAMDRAVMALGILWLRGKKQGVFEGMRQLLLGLHSAHGDMSIGICA